jgi:hypothetical protein
VGTGRALDLGYQERVKRAKSAAAEDDREEPAEGLQTYS